MELGDAGWTSVFSSSALGCLKEWSVNNSPNMVNYLYLYGLRANSCFHIVKTVGGGGRHTYKSGVFHDMKI